MYMAIYKVRLYFIYRVCVCKIEGTTPRGYKVLITRGLTRPLRVSAFSRVVVGQVIYFIYMARDNTQRTHYRVSSRRSTPPTAHATSRNACSELYCTIALAATARASPGSGGLRRAPVYAAAGSSLEPVGSEDFRSGVCGALPPLERASSEPSEVSPDLAEPAE